MSELIEKVTDYVSPESFKRPLLMDKLSEFLTVEKGGMKLYKKALDIIKNPEVREKFSQFYEQTRKHEEILTRVIRELGGDPNHMSASAKLAQQKADALLATMNQGGNLSWRESELNAMENILLAETKDHADWELLSKIVRRTDDHKLSDILGPAVSEVEPEEDDHFTWTKQRIAILSIEALSPSDGKDGGNGSPKK
jgi:rubrerythrin